MQKWLIEYWIGTTSKSPVKKWFDALTAEQLKFVSKEMRMLEIVGNALKFPHSRALGNGLFELRERRFGFRVYYAFKGNHIIIVLGASDKKDQGNAIKIARKRLSHIK